MMLPDKLDRVLDDIKRYNCEIHISKVVHKFLYKDDPQNNTGHHNGDGHSFSIMDTFSRTGAVLFQFRNMEV